MEVLFVGAVWLTIATLVGLYGFPKHLRRLGTAIGATIAMAGVALHTTIGGSLVWWLLITMILIVGTANVVSHLFEHDTKLTITGEFPTTA